MCEQVTNKAPDVNEHRHVVSDKSLSHSGGSKKQAIDLGLELMLLLRHKEQDFTREDIAAWCGCSGEMVRQIENRALAKLRHRIKELKVDLQIESKLYLGT